MAKKSASGNKSAAIREALQANPDKGPKEIAEIVQALGFKVTPAYVSIVKYNLSKSPGGTGRKVRVKRSGDRRAEGHFEGNGFAPIDAAIQFIQAVGGLDQAKAILATVEQLKAVV
ncbi:hypothetical protein Pan44_47540 [Caulifigura coniformis]|uniref:Uncharacterized protein n=1 Tax=Caulifigura coniformis TaxID=2527983 RepID=A0A517SKP6_9PLAN|nr:hypothetical protein [Caulifigura coniformis]QDT56697.1 hypothetical protein Pan44_47540 [Caulifigura coniformis]